MVSLVKVRFTRDAVYRVRGYSHPENPVFNQGAVYEFSEDVAARWVRRGAAVVVTEQEQKADDTSVNKAATASKGDGVSASNKPPADNSRTGKAVARN